MYSQRTLWLPEPRGYNLMTADTAAGAAGGVFVHLISQSEADKPETFLTMSGPAGAT